LDLGLKILSGRLSSIQNPKSKIQNILPFENLTKGRYPVKLGVGAGVGDVGM
jgi:hypothetical protein